LTALCDNIILSGMARRAINYAKLRNIDYIFCGHTHKDNYFESRGVKYYNSGSWVDFPSSYIIIKGRNIEIKHIDK